MLLDMMVDATQPVRSKYKSRAYLTRPRPTTPTYTCFTAAPVVGPTHPARNAAGMNHSAVAGVWHDPRAAGGASLGLPTNAFGSTLPLKPGRPDVVKKGSGHTASAGFPPYPATHSTTNSNAHHPTGPKGGAAYGGYPPPPGSVAHSTVSDVFPPGPAGSRGDMSPPHTPSAGAGRGDHRAAVLRAANTNASPKFGLEGDKKPTGGVARPSTSDRTSTVVPQASTKVVDSDDSDEEEQYHRQHANPPAPAPINLTPAQLQLQTYTEDMASQQAATLFPVPDHLHFGPSPPPEAPVVPGDSPEILLKKTLAINPDDLAKAVWFRYGWLVGFAAGSVCMCLCGSISCVLWLVHQVDPSDPSWSSLCICLFLSTGVCDTRCLLLFFFFFSSFFQTSK